METFLTDSGEYALLCKPGGRLLPEALPALRAAARTGADLLYADEILLRNGKRIAVYKPVFSPDTLFSYNYIGSPVALRLPLYEALGGSFDTPLARYDLTLRATQRASGITHVAKTLFEGPAEAPADAERALRRALRRRKNPGVLSEGLFPGSYRVRYSANRNLSVSVILVYTGNVDGLRRTLESVSAAGSFLNCRFFICYGCLPDERTRNYFAALTRTRAVTIIRREGEKNAAALKNHAAENSEGDVLLFLSPGMELLSLDTLEELAAQAIRPTVGAVGGKIVSQDGKLLHTGQVLGLKNIPVSLFSGHKDNAGGPLFQRSVNCVRNVSALGGGALMIARETFFAARGFDETLPPAATGADLCLKCSRAGLYNVYTPYARLMNRSVQPHPPLTKDDETRLSDLFRAFREGGDPFLTENPAAFGREG